jgi:hypothetical protein
MIWNVTKEGPLSAAAYKVGHTSEDCHKKPSRNGSRLTKRLKIECFRRVSVLNGKRKSGCDGLCSRQSPRPCRRVKLFAEIWTIKPN